MSGIYSLTGDVSTTAKHSLGKKVTDKSGKTYRYIQVHASGTALIAGNWAYRYAVATEWVVSATPESLTNAIVGVTGVAIGTIGVGYYGWVQTSGPCALAYVNNTGAGAGTIGAVFVACSTSGAAKLIIPSTNTEYTIHACPQIGWCQISETSATTTHSLSRITELTIKLE